jgi:hypothetical protein
MVTERKLMFSVTLKDCNVQTFRAGGKGGQHQNKTETGVRIVHRASGAVGEARDSRSQADNKEAAFKRMSGSKKFQTWIKLETSRLLLGKTIEQAVEEQITSPNLKVEVQDDQGRWVVLVDKLTDS